MKALIVFVLLVLAVNLYAESYYINRSAADLPPGTKITVTIDGGSQFFTVNGGSEPVTATKYSAEYVIPETNVIGGYTIPVERGTGTVIIYGETQP